MRIKLVMSAFALFFLLVGSAQAFHWHIGYGQAKHESKLLAQETCKHDKKCTGYGVGRCSRISESRVDCEIGLFYANPQVPEEEVECNLSLHWGVNPAGEVVLKNYGKPHCFQV